MPEHPKMCDCNGRGWFLEHTHDPSCCDPDCVGCVRRQVPCRAPGNGSKDNTDV